MRKIHSVLLKPLVIFLSGCMAKSPCPIWNRYTTNSEALLLAVSLVFLFLAWVVLVGEKHSENLQAVSKNIATAGIVPVSVLMNSNVLLAYTISVQENHPRERSKLPAVLRSSMQFQKASANSNKTRKKERLCTGCETAEPVEKHEPLRINLKRKNATLNSRKTALVITGRKL